MNTLVDIKATQVDTLGLLLAQIAELEADKRGTVLKEKVLSVA